MVIDVLNTNIAIQVKRISISLNFIQANADQHCFMDPLFIIVLRNDPANYRNQMYTIKNMLEIIKYTVFIWLMRESTIAKGVFIINLLR